MTSQESSWLGEMSGTFWSASSAGPSETPPSFARVVTRAPADSAHGTASGRSCGGVGLSMFCGIAPLAAGVENMSCMAPVTGWSTR
jgi:hypothetical protein